MKLLSFLVFVLCIVCGYIDLYKPNISRKKWFNMLFWYVIGGAMLLIIGNIVWYYSSRRG